MVHHPIINKQHVTLIRRYGRCGGLMRPNGEVLRWRRGRHADFGEEKHICGVKRETSNYNVVFFLPECKWLRHVLIIISMSDFFGEAVSSCLRFFVLPVTFLANLFSDFSLRFRSQGALAGAAVSLPSFPSISIHPLAFFSPSPSSPCPLRSLRGGDDGMESGGVEEEEEEEEKKCKCW